MHRENVSKKPTLLLLALSFVSFQTLVLSTTSNHGYDHRAHAVPGKDKIVYDLNNSSFAEITLDGSGSHSHYFDDGPPVKSGFIEGYEWVDTENEAVLCSTKTCKLPFPIGSTTIKLRVWDNTGDTAEDSIKVTVLPRSQAKAKPSIRKISPNKGPLYGKNIVTLKGKHMYHDSEVYFGDAKAVDVRHVDINTLVCTAPAGSGTQKIKVVSSIGTSNHKEYLYQKTSSIPISFEHKFWKAKNGSIWKATQITAVTIGKDYRYYMGSRTGYVTVAEVNRNLVVERFCKGAFMGDTRSIGGIAFNPLDSKDRLFVSTSTYYHKKEKKRWDNAKIETVYLDSNKCPVRGETIISGLPVSNHDHGTNHIAFDHQGRMLISCGSSTNGGFSEPKDGLGGVPESPLTAAILEADYMRPGFDGEVKYDQYTNPETANVISGDVKPLATGLRNCFGMVMHSNGELYATDNGPNVNFGKTSLSCSTSGPDPESDDKLLRIVRGQYYGHPNRNRGRKDAKQCQYKSPWEPTKGGYVEPIGLMKSSTNGIIDYRANTFEGAIRGDLFLSQVAFSEDGLLWRAELSKNGEWLQEGPYYFGGKSGLSLVMGLWGELVMPQLEKSTVLVYKPKENRPKTIRMLNVYPPRGPKSGGNTIMITGSHLNSSDVQVLVGGSPCTGFSDATYNSLKCIVPEGTGKVQVIVKQGEVESTGFGPDYAYS